MLDEARHADDGEPLFLIKGGVAMELRVDTGARATKDLDTAVRWQIAQKLHACTEAFADGENDRFRDLIDLQLLEELVADDEWRDVKAACFEVFGGRGKQTWTPGVTVYESWEAGYRALAEDIGFAVVDVHEAAAAVARLIDRIDRA